MDAYDAFVAKVDATRSEKAARMGGQLELTLWRVVRGSQRAESRLRRTWDGAEVLVEIDGVMSNSIPVRLEKLALMEQVDGDLRADFLADGWQDAGPY